MTGLPTSQSNATQILPSYLYVEYSDDDDLQAFVATYTSMAQGYLDWFNGTPLALYISPNVSGPLLDWVGTNLYGIRRPVIGTLKSYSIGAVSTFPVETLPVAGAKQFISGSAAQVSDDIYKRVLTWWLYRGDGKQMSIDWIKRRVSRFLFGVNGMDISYPTSSPPSISIGSPKIVGAIGIFTLSTLPVAGSGLVTLPGFKITVPTSAIGQALQSLVANNLLALPFENPFTVVLD